MNEKMIYEIDTEMAEVVCLHHKKWGVYCSWPLYSHHSRTDIKTWFKHILSCLPSGEFTDSTLPCDCWFLRLFDDETSARDYYKQCRGEEQGIYDGVFAVLISSDGKCVTENT
jgi:hypothetical protein